MIHRERDRDRERQRETETERETEREREKKEKRERKKREKKREKKKRGKNVRDLWTNADHIAYVSEGKQLLQVRNSSSSVSGGEKSKSNDAEAFTAALSSECHANMAAKGQGVRWRGQCCQQWSSALIHHLFMSG